MGVPDGDVRNLKNLRAYSYEVEKKAQSEKLNEFGKAIDRSSCPVCRIGREPPPYMPVHPFPSYDRDRPEARGNFRDVSQGF